MTQKALKLALEALEAGESGHAEQVIREALAQPEPCDMGDICIGCSPRNADGSCPSSQRKFVGLTDDEMEATFIECGGKWNGDFWQIEDADFHPFLRTIEAKLKDKNS